MPDTLFLHNLPVSYAALADNKLPPSLTDYQQRALHFCYEWLTGKETFTLQTSGSTGNPKIITVKARHMAQSARMTAEAIGLKPNDRSLVCLNTDYIAGRMMLVRGFVTGMVMTIIPPSSNPLAPFTGETSFDFIAMVPLQMQTILAETPEKKKMLDSMKGILLGGAALDTSLEEKVQEVTAPVYHTFGMTETLSHIALRRVNGDQRQDYYEVLKGIEIETDNKNCLVIHSPFSSVPVHTNDVVQLLDKNRFRWLGRADFVINTGGVKIHPERTEKEIEKIFYRLNIFKRFFITGMKDSRLGEAVTLVIEDRPWKPELLEELQKQLKEHLPRFEQPRAVYFREQFEQTPTGKTDRKRIAEFLEKQREPGLPDSC